MPVSVQRGDGAPGYRGSERSGCRVSVYGKTGSAISLYDGNQTFHFDGRQQDGVPAVIACSTAQSLSAGGSFNFVLKFPSDFDPLTAINVDAWVDISFTRFATEWHVMRGMVDEVRVTRQVTPAGTAVTQAMVMGRSFQKAWSTTTMWFNAQLSENIAGSSLFQITPEGVAVGSPTRNVKNLLFSLFNIISSKGRANWALPSDIPGPTGTITDAVAFDTSLFGSTLPRNSPTGQLFAPNIDVWTWAQNQFGDGQFCELFTDILPQGGWPALARDPQMADGLLPAKSQMTVVMRDKPFPIVDPVAQVPIGLAGPWFSLPTWEVAAQEVGQYNLGVSSAEVLNAFSFTGNFGLEPAANDLGQIRSILARPDDERRHGTRFLPVATPYRSSSAQDRAFAHGLRARLRDWYCMGDELVNGGVSLSRLFPELRIGGRLRVAGGGFRPDLTGYLESIRHEWSPNHGRTSCDITRGWRGTDADLVARLTTISSAYYDPAPTS